ncbi:hypothetical protein, conserved [Trypanosoma brucei brucei TREU927]|uniref:non-specific serine/threonine protein kinase n=1 Tax=Trypanosoma brucei brucei (strain 927/4 GUTat10.1) TaxID=185431 RepID=Q580A8_TRYB2|nr:hypothetical protein, conserved [Trypanosoma brucei brucei TREU927]AAX80939.1 hypothetical protein, conserved [Trypanosoma brucei]AAZ10671.1 hypothetical protein, conserved [Trypanosoma brucei brucei TREU927]
MSNIESPRSSRPFGDSASALTRQFGLVFSNLQNAPDDRPRRVEECLSALLDILVAHALELSEHCLIDYIFQLLCDTFGVSISKGVKSLRVVFDVHLGDPHELRCRCFTLLVRKVCETTNEADCNTILQEMGEVLRENVRSTSDLLGKHFGRAITTMQSSSVTRAKAVGCQTVATMVDAGAVVIKRSPALLDLLNTPCSPPCLIHEIMESNDNWHRQALTRLLVNIAESHCIEVTASMAEQMASTMTSHLSSATEEKHITGLLTVIDAISASSTLQTVPWSLEAVASFVVQRDWRVYTEDVRVRAARATGKILPLLVKDEKLYDLVMKNLLSYISGGDEAVALSALTTFRSVIKSLNNIESHAVLTVDAVSDFIAKSPFNQLAFEILDYLRTQCGEQCVFGVYDLLERADVLNSVEKVAALLHFMGNRAPSNVDWLEECNIDLSPDSDVDVLVRSLSFLETLRYTEALESAVGLVFHKHTDVRRAAVGTVVSLCEVLLSPDKGGSCQGSHVDATITQLNSRVKIAVESLLDVAVTDRQMEIRYYTLKRLSPVFEPYLVQLDNIDALFMSRNDVCRGVRDQAMLLLYRLHSLQPDILHAQLLQLQEYMLREIDVKDGSISSTVYHAFLLQMAAENGTILLSPSTVETSVLRRLEKQPFVSKSLSVALLNLLRAVLDHSGPRNHCDAKQLIQPVLAIVNGSTSSTRRKAAIEALCSILATVPITEQSTHVSVYRALSRIIRGEAEESEAVIYSAMKCLSVIGAVDPTKARYIVKALQEGEIAEEEEVATPALALYKPRLRIHLHMDERYPCIVLYLLVKTLQHSADVEQQASVISVIHSMIHEVPGRQKAMLLTQFLPQLQAWLADPEKVHLYEVILLLMSDLATLLQRFKDVIPASTGLELLKSVRLFCLLPQASQKPLNAGVVELLDRVGRGLSPEEMRDHRWAVEFIHQRLLQDKRDLALVVRAVKSLDSFLAILHERDFQVLLPHVLGCIEPADAATPNVPGLKKKEVNTACFEFLNQIMAKQPLLMKDFCSQIIHTITWYIEESDCQDEMEMGLRTLAFLVGIVQRPARRFIKPIQRLVQQCGLPEDMFTNLLKSAADGLLKARAPLSGHDNLNPELPLTLVSDQPSLSKEDFQQVMKRVLRLGDHDFEVISVTHSEGNTVVYFRFVQGEDLLLNFRSFTSKAQESQSTLSRNLGILKLVQNAMSYCQVDDSLLENISRMPVANKKKREQSWMAWLHNTSVVMLKNSPIQPLRCTAQLAADNTGLSRDLFPFAAAAFIGKLNAQQQEVIIKAFTRALEVSPNDIKQAIFDFAEFIESERGKLNPEMILLVEKLTFVVERDNEERKFGINYDEVSGDVVVSHLEPGGPGALAGVPVGARLLALNGKRLVTTHEVVGAVKGLNRIELTLECPNGGKRGLSFDCLMDIDVLARVALNSKMYARAIFLNEILFAQLLSELSGQVSDRQNAAVRHALEVAERLIEFYNHLGLTMVAKGLVKKMSEKFSSNIIAPEQFGFDEVGALEQLNWWGEALSRYKSRMNVADGTLDTSAFLGALRCYDALGETITMQELIATNWELLDRDAQLEVAPLKAKAALWLGRWDEFDEVVGQPGVMERLDMVERCASLFRQKHYGELLDYVDEHRKSLFDSFFESFTESYNRSYDTLVELQHVRHFEELVSFVKSGSERRKMLRELWHKRVTLMSSRPAHIKTLITINSLVLSPQEDLPSQVVCVRALTKHHWTSLADHTLSTLLHPNGLNTRLANLDPDVIHVYMKHCYVTRGKQETYTLLSDILNNVQLTATSNRAEAWGCCWLLLGEWTVQLFPDCGTKAIETLRTATQLCPENCAAFHSLGILHYDLSRDPNTSQETQTKHHIESITALFKAVALSRRESNGVMEDVLRILSIWFSHSTVNEVNEAIQEGIKSVPCYVWLNVIPQLVARIGITGAKARSILTDLLVSIGSNFPHALLYPLTVTEKSPEVMRRQAAERVLKGIRVTNGPMVEEASLISNEMVRIAILWTEKWHNCIQLAAGKPENVSEIRNILRPLYEEMKKESTPNEQHFVKVHGSTLRRAWAALQKGESQEAWVLLKQVYCELHKAVGERRLQMDDLSPTLVKINKSNVPVPGTFVLGQQLITIQKFHSRVYVMPSKQRPRRFGVDGSDGSKYRFLLKGHEDLRQDERVMQFIELINTIFSSDSLSNAMGLIIPQYAVIPLTDNVGIIGWVENTETIYKMLERWRKDHNISIYKEVSMIVEKGKLVNITEYHHRNKQERKQLLSHVMASTPDDELRRIIWDKNDTCEHWLQYRGTYGHTLAIMSIVGYVLGLGDRHLNNLMLQDKGSVVHIDFGDCFEVAMHRSLYSEAVPFRLTRLLVPALGITGVDGVFRLTCELVMKILRRHSENLLSILEAFIYDPLINWRLTTVAEGENSASLLEAPVAGGEASPFAEPDGLIDGPPMQLSRSVLKVREQAPGTTLEQTGEEETRNTQGDLALARVRAKLTGEDFADGCHVVAGQPSRREVSEDPNDPFSWWSQGLAESSRDVYMTDGRALPSWSSFRTVNNQENLQNVASQVDRLIEEATSLDNLAEAYITGWAPFW